MKNFYLILLLLSSTAAMAQLPQRNFKGRVIDSTTQQPLGDVSICIYRASDTSLLNFGFTTPIGNFALSVKSEDSLLVVISLLNYSDFNYKEGAKSSWSFKYFQDIKLARLPFQFRAVSVKTAAIRMKGDTIEINANKFKVLPGSDVAQLFKKIPGFEVNVKGEIKVAGADVNKILVDGSDFFGNNPGMVSKNLTADMIETVQVFDERNEDGSPKDNVSKVINLKLKKGKKNGLFGDVLAGYGTKDRYEGGIRMNNFKNDRKFSFVLNSNNINETGFDFGFNNWHSADYYERNGTFGDNGISYYYGDQGDGNINQKTSSGFTYFNEFSKKRKLSFSGMVTRNDYSSINSSNNIYAINDTTRRTKLDSTSSNGRAQSANFEVAYTKTLDSTGKFDIGATLKIKDNLMNTHSVNEIKLNQMLLNEGNTFQKNDFRNQSLEVNSSYRRYLRKDKRYNLFAYAGYIRSDDNSDAFQYTGNSFDTFNTRSKLGNTRNELLFKASGKMPVYKKLIYFNLAADKWIQDNRTFQTALNAISQYDRSFEQGYDQKVDSLSIQFKNRQDQMTLKPFFSFEKKSLWVSLGLTAMQMKINSDNETSGQSVGKKYNLYLPNFNISYYPENKAYLYLTLSQQTRFPTANELQPVVNISQTYERMAGNTDLKPQVNNRLGFYTNFYGLKGFRYLYNNFNLMTSNNAIIRESKQMEDGVIIRIPVNASGYMNIHNWFSTSKKIKKDFYGNFYLSYDYSKSPNIINKIVSSGTYTHLSLSPSFSYNKSDSMEINFGMTMDRTSNTNSLNSNLNYKQWLPGYNASIRGIIKYGTEMNTHINISDRRNVPGIGKVIPVWSAYIQQPIGKKGVSIKFSVYDILNKNTNIDRVSTDNFVSISQNNQLRRYFMLTLVFKIKKMGNNGDGEDYTF